MKQKIHPLIENINISEKVKRYFNCLEFYEIIEDAIVLSTISHEVDECEENRWSFGVDLKYCNTKDLLAFYQSVMDARRQYLILENIKTKMIFYTWYDPMSGYFYFSIIPANWSKLLPGQELPFGCTVNKVDKLENIISNFINDPYKGIIPMDQLKEISLSEALKSEDEEDPKQYILDVWSITL
jgi:hypothetical protein